MSIKMSAQGIGRSRSRVEIQGAAGWGYNSKDDISSANVCAANTVCKAL